MHRHDRFDRRVAFGFRGQQGVEARLSDLGRAGGHRHKRIGGAGDSYTASPVAADGRLYFASEQGEVRVVKAGPNDRYGDILVDTNKSHEVYRRWLEIARPAPGPDGLRRPLWLPR